MPQFDLAWLFSQIFWFSLFFGVFSICCSKFIVAKIEKIQNARKKMIDSILSEAQDLLKSAEQIRSELDHELDLLEKEVSLIMNRAKKESVDFENNCNNGLKNEISDYKNLKHAELEQLLHKRSISYTLGLSKFANNIGKKIGLQDFCLSDKDMSNIQDDLKSLNYE